MCTKFQVDCSLSKTTLIKNTNLKLDRQTNERTNRPRQEQTHRPENIMPLYYRRLGINKQKIKQNNNNKQECVHSTRMPHSHYHIPCSVDLEIGVKTLIWNLNLKDHIIGNMCPKFQVDVTSTSSKTTLTKNFNQNFNLNVGLSLFTFSGP